MVPSQFDIYKCFHHTLDTEVMDSAFKMLLPIIPTPCQWFGDLPIDRYLEAQIIDFLTQFSSWDGLVDMVKVRSYPLTANDLTRDLFCRSLPLKRLLFLESVEQYQAVWARRSVSSKAF